MRLTTFIAGTLLATAPLACAGAQGKDDRGPAFCESYETNFLTACRSNCEATKDVRDPESLAECDPECKEQLLGPGRQARRLSKRA